MGYFRRIILLCDTYTYSYRRGEDVTILAKRKTLYRRAKSENPKRWSGEIRNWEPVKEVYLNPEKQKIVTEENKVA